MYKQAWSMQLQLKGKRKNGGGGNQKIKKKKNKKNHKQYPIRCFDISPPFQILVIISCYTTVQWPARVLFAKKVGLEWTISQTGKKGTQILLVEKVIIQVLMISYLCWLPLPDTGTGFLRNDFSFSYWVLFGKHYLLNCWYYLVVAWYSRLRVIAELRHGDIFHTPNIVSRWVEISCILYNFI
jgi:hypothetical protein